MRLQIPADLLPADGRFGSGPSKVPDGRLQALAATGHTLMGTSHRQPPVKQLVRRVREGVATLFDLPEGYEVVLGNGGSIGFFSLATYALIRERSQHVVYGEFAKKFAREAQAAPWLGDPTILSAPHGSRALAVSVERGASSCAAVTGAVTAGTAAGWPRAASMAASSAPW